MTEAQTLELEFMADDKLAGFRMRRLEIYNWGTFNGRIWTVGMNGRNALLTGEIGSGKSTVVDAVTALLVPAHRVAFNRAAGAEAKERSARSYVLGYYKSERSDVSGVAKPVPLRDHTSYSVILGVFHNVGYDQTITLAQVFWMKDPQGQPARFYATFEGDLNIATHFAGFGSDVNVLRKRLRNSGIDIFDNFPPYGAWFRRRLGIDNEQALDLFHQTVSMKSVGNLTDFVRTHMLQPFDVTPRLQALIGHFDDLSRAHEAVLKAKRQMEMLTPLVGDCERFMELANANEQARRWRDLLKPYFAGIKLELLEARIADLDEELTKRDSQVTRFEEQRRDLQRQDRDLRQTIAQNGGDRIARIVDEIRQNEEKRDDRKRRAHRYDELARTFDMSAPNDPDTFQHQRNAFEQIRAASAQREANLQNSESEARVRAAELRREHELVAAEIQSLKARRSNIESRQMMIRAALCAQTGLDEDAMPFAGELLQVREEARDWEGAIERYLRSFGLSMLVPEEHYATVADWVNRTHLGDRLVYFRVRDRGRADLSAVGPDSLLRKIAIKPDSPLYTWLEREVTHRFDVVCCDSQEHFRREIKAITRAGQIKSPGERHEKDDRHQLNDRARYVLGWNNVEKIAALEAQARGLATTLADIESRVARLHQELGTVRQRLQTLSKLDEYRDFQEIDWKPAAAAIESLREEKHKLETSSDLLASLYQLLAKVEEAVVAVEARLEDQKDKRSRVAQKKLDVEALSLQTREYLDASAASERHRSRDALERLRAEALGEQQITVESCDKREQEVRQWLQSRLDADERRLGRLREHIVNAMTNYKNSYPVDTQEADAAVEAAGEYRAMLDQLVSDDLPRFEARFKELLNENTIREVVNFQGQLARERETIKERVAHINESLTQIDYNAGRYIRIEAQPTQDVDIRDFQSELRACTDDTLAGADDDQYSETRFLQVKAIIDRFRGRDGRSDLDARWTAKVTDVRNWFVFAASERWREDNTEYEHYSDSGGKSGGQKEKLAYTVLAASLAYQFGLEWGAVRSRSFRFVVIDEAFGRGSNESAQYGLELFARLNLQLLIVTPLQKIHVIEPYVANVGFVHNEDGRESKLRNLSIEEYRAERARATA